MFRFLDNAATVQHFRGNFIVRCKIPVERFETHFNPLFFENIREAAFWQAAMKGHLAPLEAGLRRIAGTRFLPFFAAAGSFSEAGSGPAPDALLFMSRALCGMEIV